MPTLQRHSTRLLVGGADLPKLARSSPPDIRFSDVLVALPQADSASLIAYDLGKETAKGAFPLLRGGRVARSAIDYPTSGT